MRFTKIFLDMDDTLFDFQKSEREALQYALDKNGIVFTPKLADDFHQINDNCWKQFERGELTRTQVQLSRYAQLFSLYGIHADAQKVNTVYMRQLGESAYLTDGAYRLCEQLHEKADLYIVTNGVAKNQIRRLQKSGLEQFMRAIFISEQMGCKKPQKEFFDIVFRELGISDKRDCILLGDSPTSDIAGARNAGIASCLFSKQDIPCGYDYRIERLEEFIGIVSHKNKD